MFGSGLQTEQAFDTVWRVARTHVRRQVVASLLMASVAILVLRATPGSAEPSPSSRDRVARYVIRPGDTLWSIARGLAPSEDPRRVVDELERRNDLDPEHLVPGQAIVFAAEV
jgi:LysM repeat protein